MCKDKVPISPRRSSRLAQKREREQQEQEESSANKAKGNQPPIHHSVQQFAPGGGGSGQSSAGPKLVYTKQGEIDVEQTASTNNASIGEVLAAIRQQFGDHHSTLRIKMPTGKKTIAAGGEAFTDPQETEKQRQAMVSYRQGDYGSHKKVGKDFDDFANELSDDDESESEKRKRAKRIGDHLNVSGNTDNFSDHTDAQRAAIGGLLLVSHVSDPLRTDANSNRTEIEFQRQLGERAKGKTTFHTMFGDKKKSTYLPARTKGAKQQRKVYAMKDKDVMMEEEKEEKDQ